MREAQAALARDGLVVRDAKGGPKRHPCAGVEREARAAWLRALRLLNLRPDQREPDGA